MPLTLKPTSSAEFESPSEGSHQAVCVAVIDLGTQESTYEGQTTVAHKVMLAYEILGEEKEAGGPFVVARDYTFSLNEKAALRVVVKALRGGKDVGPDEEVSFKSLLGKNCIVSIEHKTSAGGKSYAKLAGVQPPMKGSKPAPGTLAPVCWEMDSGAPLPSHDWLPYLYGKKLADVVAQSAEWKGGKAAANLQAQAEEAF